MVKTVEIRVLDGRTNKESLMFRLDEIELTAIRMTSKGLKLPLNVVFNTITGFLISEYQLRSKQKNFKYSHTHRKSSKR